MLTETVEPGLGAVVDRLCAHDREGRFRHPEEAILALAPFSAGECAPMVLGEIVRTRTHRGSKNRISAATISMETGRISR